MFDPKERKEKNIVICYIIMLYVLFFILYIKIRKQKKVKKCRFEKVGKEL